MVTGVTGVLRSFVRIKWPSESMIQRDTWTEQTRCASVWFRSVCVLSTYTRCLRHLLLTSFSSYCSTSAICRKRAQYKPWCSCSCEFLLLRSRAQVLLRDYCTFCCNINPYPQIFWKVNRFKIISWLIMTVLRFCMALLHWSKPLRFKPAPYDQNFCSVIYK